jgi:hypothetical protein
MDRKLGRRVGLTAMRSFAVVKVDRIETTG